MRDELWLKSIKKAQESGAILQIWTDKNPQGFSCRQFGGRERSFVDFEGLSLIKIEQPGHSGPDKNADTI